MHDRLTERAPTGLYPFTGRGDTIALDCGLVLRLADHWPDLPPGYESRRRGMLGIVTRED